MGTYIALIDYTEKGVAAIEDSPVRSEAFIAKAAEMGAQVRDVYWTFGGHDGVLIGEFLGSQDVDQKTGRAA